MRPVTREAFTLGEGPVWDAAGRRLLWVDIVAGEVLEGTLGDSVEVSARTRFAETVGAVAVADDGGLLVAAQEHLVVLSPDGARVDGPRVVPSGEPRRLNDGATDPAGRFLVGTLCLGEPTGREVLVRLEHDGTLTTLDDDLTLSNGLAWSPDGTLLYSVDTLRHVIHVRDYDAGTGAVGERREHLRVEPGYPDGIAADASGHLWVAVWGAGAVHRYDPAGALEQVVPVPAPHTSSVAFAGDDLRTLVVATATRDLTPDELAEHPLSGRLFAARVDVPGLPSVPWRRPSPVPPADRPRK